MDNKGNLKNNKKGLGRGIGSLLGGGSGSSTQSSNEEMSKSGSKLRVDSVLKNNGGSKEESVVTPNAAVSGVTVEAVDPLLRIWNLPVEKLRPSPYQPRQTFDKQELEELANSIKVNGILQPIIARKVGDHFEIIAGERRWRAAQIAGQHDVPVILKTFGDLETLELAIIENIQRSDLNPIEEAEAYMRLATQFDLSQAQIAEKVGKERATVANAIRLLQLTRSVKDLVQQGQLSVGHAKVLLSVTDEKQQAKLAKLSIQNNYSVRKLEGLIKNSELEGSEIQSTVSTQQKLDAKLIGELENKLKQKLNTNVGIQYNQGKGNITIHFYEKNQFNELIERLMK